MYIAQEDICIPFLDRLTKFRSKIGVLPEELEQSTGLINRQPDWFDPVRFLEIFPTIKLRPGYTLNYFYLKNDQGGRPIIYTRKNDKSSLSHEEMDNMLHHMTQTSELIKHLEFDRSSLGFFQFAVFNVIVHQFYLTGRSVNFNTSFLFSRSSLKIYRTIIKRHDHNLGCFDIDKIITEPRIKMFDAYNAEVTLTMFSKRSGIFYNTIHVEWPSTILKTENEILVNYDNKVVFQS